MNQPRIPKFMQNEIEIKRQQEVKGNKSKDVTIRSDFPLRQYSFHREKREMDVELTLSISPLLSNDPCPCNFFPFNHQYYYNKNWCIRMPFKIETIYFVLKILRHTPTSELESLLTMQELPEVIAK